MDLNYIKYQLKSFFISDFKFKEKADILNNQEPEIFARQYVKFLKLNARHETLLRLKLRLLIDKAYSDGVPLGSEKGHFENMEEAYLFRQRYLNQYYTDNSLISIFNKTLLILLTAALCILFVFVL